MNVLISIKFLKCRKNKPVNI